MAPPRPPHRARRLRPRRRVSPRTVRGRHSPGVSDVAPFLFSNGERAQSGRARLRHRGERSDAAIPGDRRDPSILWVAFVASLCATTVEARVGSESRFPGLISRPAVRALFTAKALRALVVGARGFAEFRGFVMAGLDLAIHAEVANFELPLIVSLAQQFFNGNGGLLVDGRVKPTAVRFMSCPSSVAVGESCLTGRDCRRAGERRLFCASDWRARVERVRGSRALLW